MSTTRSCSVRVETSGAQETTASRASSSGSMISSGSPVSRRTWPRKSRRSSRAGRPRSRRAACGGPCACGSSSRRSAAPGPCAPSRTRLAVRRPRARAPAGRISRSCRRHGTGCPSAGQSACGNCSCRGPARHRAPPDRAGGGAGGSTVFGNAPAPGGTLGRHRRPPISSCASVDAEVTRAQVRTCHRCALRIVMSNSAPPPVALSRHRSALHRAARVARVASMSKTTRCAARRGSV